MVEDSDEHRPLKQAQHITKWNKFLKKFARSEGILICVHLISMHIHASSIANIMSK